MRLFILLFLIIFSLFTYSQSASDRLINKGVSLHDKGKYQDAISYYQQALKVNPSSMSAVYEMSLSYLSLKDYNNSLKYSTKIINSNFTPLLIDAYCVKSSALANMNKLDQAIKLLQEGLAKCGDQYLLHYNLGLNYFKIKNLDMSLFHLQKAIEIDTTQPNAFLLYAYASNDSHNLISSFLSFQFFLLLEPNTDRSKEAFKEMYNIIDLQSIDNLKYNKNEFGINTSFIFNYLLKIRPKIQDDNFRYAYFQESTEFIFSTLSTEQNESKKGLIWDFFIPIDSEILQSGNFETYCRYISVSHFSSSLEWWKNNKIQVDNFILWFEDGREDSDGDDSVN